MNLEIRINGVDKHEHTISYSRNQNICSSIGTLDVVFDPDLDLFLTLEPYDEITIFENGIKKGTYYIIEFTRAANTGEYTVQCQDKSKRLQDFWLTTTYSTKNHITARYWISKFLDDAGIDYEFDLEDGDSVGGLINNDMTFGPCSAYDVVIQMLQMSSWYMYFNADGQAIIGELFKSTDSTDLYADDYNIVSLRTNKNDKMLRNRVVVWGKSDPYNRGWVYADVSKSTAWDYDENDKRAVVISNSYIENATAAYSLASKAIKEFTKLTYEKELVLSDAYDVVIGNVVEVNSKYYQGVGIATSVGSIMNKDVGIETTITLDQRCPRIYAYYSFGNPVYIGTKSHGVWKKPLQYHVWSDYNTGLPAGDRHIVDLAASAGTLVCVTANGNAYMRTPLTTGWSKINIIDGTCADPDGHSYLASELDAVCCDINKATCEVHVAYIGQPNAIDFPDKWQSFIITATSYNKFKVSLVKDTIGGKYYKVYDLTTNEKDVLISACGEVSGNYTIYPCSTEDTATSYIGNTLVMNTLTNEVPAGSTLTVKEVDSTYQYRNQILCDGTYTYRCWTVLSYIYITRRHIREGTTDTVNLTNSIQPYYSKGLALCKDGKVLIFGLSFTPEETGQGYYGYALVDFDAGTSTRIGAAYKLVTIFQDYPEGNGWGITASTRSMVTFPISDNEFMSTVFNSYAMIGFIINVDTTLVTFKLLAVGTPTTDLPEYWLGLATWNFTVNPVLDKNKLVFAISRQATTGGPGG